MGKLALALSRNEARFFEREQVLPEHILLALVGIRQCGAFHLLLDYGLNLHLVVREIVAASGFGPRRKSSTNPSLSAASIHVIEIAEADARALSAKQVGTEHLLLGLLGDRSLASEVLANRFGVQLREVRRMVKDRIRENTIDGPQNGSYPS